MKGDALRNTGKCRILLDSLLAMLVVIAARQPIKHLPMSKPQCIERQLTMLSTWAGKIETRTPSHIGTRKPSIVDTASGLGEGELKPYKGKAPTT